MFKNKIFIFSFITLILVAVLNYIGIKFNLYWVYRWYDIPMHMLGGLWVSLFTLFLYTYFCHKITIINCKIKLSGIIFFVLLFITISWEVFELLGGITSWAHRGYWPDTLDDILNAYIGGMIAYFLFLKNKKSNNRLIINDNNQIN